MFHGYSKNQCIIWYNSIPTCLPKLGQRYLIDGHQYSLRHKFVPEALSGLSIVLWLFQITLSLAEIVGVESVESNLVCWQSTSFPLGASEAGNENSGEVQDRSFWGQI